MSRLITATYSSRCLKVFHCSSVVSDWWSIRTWSNGLHSNYIWAILFYFSNSIFCKRNNAKIILLIIFCFLIIIILILIFLYQRVILQKKEEYIWTYFVYNYICLYICSYIKNFFTGNWFFICFIFLSSLSKIKMHELYLHHVCTNLYIYLYRSYIS